MVKMINNKDSEFFNKYMTSLMDLHNKQQQMNFVKMLNKYPSKNSNTIYEWEIMGNSNNK